MPSSQTPESSPSISSSAGMSTLAFTKCQAARHSRFPATPLYAGTDVGASTVRICYGLPDCSVPCADLTGFPANGTFYVQAFSGSVALPAAGYDYSIDWTPMLAGLSPAGMAARLAAPAPAAYASRMMLPPPLQGLRPAGWLAFTGRELNPLDHDERFPSCYISSPFPGFTLTLRHPKPVTSAD